MGKTYAFAFYRTLVYCVTLTFKEYKIPAYSKRAPKTKNMQAIIQEEMAVIPKIKLIQIACTVLIHGLMLYRTVNPLGMVPSTFGELLVIVLKMLVSTRNRVTRRAILPGMTSGGIRKLTHETTTNRPDGR